MKTAYLESRKKKIPVTLIDVPIKITLKKLSKLSFRRKMSMFSSLFLKSFKKEYRNQLSFDVKDGVPDEKTINQMLKIVEKEVPDMYRILIGDRNKYMVDKIMKLREVHEGPILAVVGAGHLEGMYEILSKKLSYNSSHASFSFITEE